MSEFTDYLCDVFIQFGSVTARSMFGGHGLYFDSCMFGLVADDTLYLKVDEKNLHYFTELDLPAFEYEKSNGRTMEMSYRMAPESIYEDPDEAALWAVRAWEAAKRAKSRKSAIGKKRKTKKTVAKKVKRESVKRTRARSDHPAKVRVRRTLEYRIWQGNKRLLQMLIILFHSL